MTRSRTFEWADPTDLAKAGQELAGLEFVRAMASGKLPAPPITATLNFDLDEVETGRAVFSFEPSEEHYNPIGSVHGGVYATLLDSAAGCAVHSTLPAGTAYTTLDLNVKFLRPISSQTGRVRAIGTIINAGRKIVLAQAVLVDSRERLLAQATSSCMLFSVA
ncbi:PaaI family thioesterase [Streptomyces sp. NPDC090080]|uniref:PaaI family thioesterase n=1 Tax=Streptomyces sp. NPDC090080 TaxID=3365939 RepID=UPI00380EC1A1